MNLPSRDGVRVKAEELEECVRAIAAASGLVPDRASLLASLLVTNDLRGVFSHGSVQVATYARLMRDGKLNGAPHVRVVRETPVSLLVDGDGGLGYFPSWDGTQALCRKAKEAGIAVLVTRNHGHFGAAGIYARIPIEHELLSFVTSGHQLRLEPEASHYAAAGGSPMAFGVPSDGAPIVVDFGCMHDLYASDPHRDTIAGLAPGLVLRSIGLGEICQTWGGFLSGLNLDPDPPVWQWPGANQGAMVIACRVDLFTETPRFKREVAQYVERIRRLSPLPGLGETFAAGDYERRNEERYRAEGIPLSPAAVAALDETARDFGVGPISSSSPARVSRRPPPASGTTSR